VSRLGQLLLQKALQSLLQRLFGIVKTYTRYSEAAVSNKYFPRQRFFATGSLMPVLFALGSK
jgi:hypothetical protein